MPSRTAIQIIVGLVIIVFAVGIWSTGDTFEPGWLRFFSVAVVVVSIAFAIWNKVLWRTRLAQKFSKVPRYLGGTWRGTLTSFWTDPETGKPPPPKIVFLVIRQTASTVGVTLLTDESRSTSSLSTVTTNDGAASLDYMFLNRPDSRVEHRSRMHHGSTSLDVTGRPASRLHGRYWTNRDSRGELDFTERIPAAAEDFDQAKRLFEPSNVHI